MATEQRILLINPNATEYVTERMAVAAREELGAAWHVEEMTNAGAPSIITDDAGLELATNLMVEAFEKGRDPLDGVIVAAFGDPALQELKSMLPVPVVGIAESGMLEAAEYGNFAIVTPTPDLFDAINGLAERYGVRSKLAAQLTTETDAYVLMSQPEALVATLRGMIEEAVADGGVDAVVIGGGPLADAARELAASNPPCPIVGPVPAAARRIRKMIEGA
ncbi:aspartate/glutamate racemase family protein [Nisaea sp.]|uniref:aspartate/glutamate racemase family protein n=1 Tax=Nisaea sp. TaxID=2024842 RepID=UPI003B529CB9